MPYFWRLEAELILWPIFDVPALGAILLMHNRNFRDSEANLSYSRSSMIDTGVEEDMLSMGSLDLAGSGSDLTSSSTLMSPPQLNRTLKRCEFDDLLRQKKRPDDSQID